MTGIKGTRRADIAFAMYDSKDTRPQLAEQWVYIDAEYEAFGYLYWWSGILVIPKSEGVDHVGTTRDSERQVYR